MFVLSVSSPRSGSSWYFKMTNALMIANNDQDISAIAERFRWLFPDTAQDFTLRVLYGRKLLSLAIINQLGGNFALRSHAKPTRGLRILTHLGIAKTTFIYRDPRDRLVSILNIAKKHRETGGLEHSFGWVKGFDDALQWIRTSYAHYLMWEKHPNTLMVRYETLVMDTYKEMQRTRDFLGLSVSDEEVSNIVKQFDKSNANLKSIHFARGQVGSYKNELSPEQIRMIDETLGDDIIKLGYIRN